MWAQRTLILSFISFSDSLEVILSSASTTRSCTMEEYKNIENDAPDPCDAYATASTATARDQDQIGQIVHHLGIEIERSQLANSRVLKATSGNIAKRLKMRQETHLITRAGKTAEAVIKQIAAKELPTNKRRMQKWKQIIIQEVGHKLQAIRRAYEKAMEVQRYDFNMKIEKVKERLRQEEMQSALFANEIKALKTQKQASGQRTSQDTPTAMNLLAIQPSLKPNDGIKFRNKKDEIDEIGDSQKPGNSQGQIDISATPDPPSSSMNSRVKRRDYASASGSKPVKIPEQP